VQDILATVGICLAVALCVYTAAYFVQVQPLVQLGSHRFEPGLSIREVRGPLPSYSSVPESFFAPIHALDRHFLRPKLWPQAQFFTNVLTSVSHPN
jgi:hypothetical protein